MLPLPPKGVTEGKFCEPDWVAPSRYGPELSTIFSACAGFAPEARKSPNAQAISPARLNSFGMAPSDPRRKVANPIGGG